MVVPKDIKTYEEGKHRDLKSMEITAKTDTCTKFHGAKKPEDLVNNYHNAARESCAYTHTK